MNGTLIGGSCGGNASPTSSLFPSITSLFQSPIGTPRVTPTPQQYAAAYLFNDDQFHSLIYSTTAATSNSNNTSSSQQQSILTNGGVTNSMSNHHLNHQDAALIEAHVQQTFQLTNGVSAADLSPLFNNLISAAGMNGGCFGSSTSHPSSSSSQAGNLVAAVAAAAAAAANAASVNSNNTSESSANKSSGGNVLLSTNN